jgi:MFS family permease
VSAISGQGRRDLRLLAAGVAVSAAGDALALVPLRLALADDGAGWIAALLAAWLVPVVLLAGVIGTIVDRFETRRALLWAVTGQAIFAIPLAFAHAPGLVVVLFLAVATFSAVVRPATNALIPAIAGEDEATRGYSRIALGMSLGFVAGPALGGVLTGTFGAQAALLVNAATFAGLAVACFGLRTRRAPAVHAAGSDDQDDAHARRAGFHVLWHDRVLRVVLVISAVATASAVLDNVAAPFRFIDQLGTTATGYGLYLTIWGLGMLAGSQLPPRWSARRQPQLVAAGQLLCCLGIAGIGVAPGLLVAYVASVLGGVGNGVANVAQNALVGTRVPDAQRGRAFAANGAVMQGATAVGTAAGGPVVAVLDAGTAMLLAGLVGAAGAAAGLLALRSPR